MKEITKPIFDLVLGSRFNIDRYSDYRLALSIENPDDIDECIDYVKGFALRVVLRSLSISSLNIDVQEDSFTISSNVTEGLIIYSAIEENRVILKIYLKTLYEAKLKSEE